MSSKHTLLYKRNLVFNNLFVLIFFFAFMNCRMWVLQKKCNFSAFVSLRSVKYIYNFWYLIYYFVRSLQKSRQITETTVFNFYFKTIIWNKKKKTFSCLSFVPLKAETIDICLQNAANSVMFHVSYITLFISTELIEDAGNEADGLVGNIFVFLCAHKAFLVLLFLMIFLSLCFLCR